MDSRGAVTGGATLRDLVATFARDGYEGTFRARPDSTLECGRCRSVLAPREVRLRSLRRHEGASDPDDMGAVAALECPRCGNRGTATFSVGANTPPEDGEILRALADHRPSTRIAREESDTSLVRDTGWRETGF